MDVRECLSAKRRRSEEVREVGAAMGDGAVGDDGTAHAKTLKLGQKRASDGTQAAQPSKLQNFQHHRSQGPELVTASA